MKKLGPPFESDYVHAVRKLKNEFGEMAPKTCIVTGTAGPYFGGRKGIMYENLGEYPRSIFGKMIPGHEGMVKKITLANEDVMNLSGRIHLFQKYDVSDVTFLVRAMALYGVKNFILTNASGSLKSYFQPGMIVNVTDHISFLMSNPMIGMEIKNLGKQFTDMKSPYNLSPLIHTAMIESGISGKSMSTHGTYLGLTGPTFESPAEAKMLSIFADIVGMSTIPEVIALRAMGCNVGALSLVTNWTYAVDSKDTISHEKNLSVTKEADVKLKNILSKTIALM